MIFEPQVIEFVPLMQKQFTEDDQREILQYAQTIVSHLQAVRGRRFLFPRPPTREELIGTHNALRIAESISGASIGEKQAISFIFSRSPPCMRPLADLKRICMDDLKWAEVHKLPYLDAVMKEAMRLSPFLNLPLDREVPPDGTNINGFYIPGGTTVGCHSSLIGLDKAFYGEDAYDFKPERWFSEHRSAMERNSLVFGSGKRMCLGFHIAELEIKKTIPVMIRDFDVSTLFNINN